MIKITKANGKATRYACLHFHYAKIIPGIYISYNIYQDDQWCGCILFGAGANNHIGSSYNLLLGEVCELLRVALNGKQQATSQCVAAAIKQFHQDNPQYKLIVSYADADQNHYGTIYQATNWIYTGITESNSANNPFIINGKIKHKKSLEKFIKKSKLSKSNSELSNLEIIQNYLDKNAYVMPSKGKYKYLYPLTKQMRKQIEPLRKPYPKNPDNLEGQSETEKRKLERINHAKDKK